MEQRFHVGFIGLGNMGLPIAHRILDAGWPLHVWARRPESCAELVAKGAVLESSPRAVAQACDFVGLCLRTDAELQDLLVREPDGVLGGMRKGGAIAVHSTVLPRTVKDLEERARALGVGLLDAPVSGGPKGAAAGTLLVLLGGDEAVVERARPLLAAFSSTAPCLGPVGAGQALKLLNNNLCYANIAMSIAALALCEQLGFDAAAAARVIGAGSGASHGLGVISDPQSLKKISGPTSNVGKDVGHLVELLLDHGVTESALTDVSKTAEGLIEIFAKSPAAERLGG